MKFFHILIVLFLFTSCGIKIPVVKNEADFYKSHNLIIMGNDGQLNKHDSLYAKYKGCKSFTVCKFYFNRPQRYYNEWLSGKISTIAYDSIKEKLSHDELLCICQDTNTTTTIKIFLGKLSNDQYFIVPDSNNDGSFFNDSAIVLTNMNVQPNEKHHRITFINVSGCYNNQLLHFKFEASVKVSPTTQIQYSTIELSDTKSYIGNKKINGNSYSFQLIEFVPFSFSQLVLQKYLYSIRLVDISQKMVSNVRLFSDTICLNKKNYVFKQKKPEDGYVKLKRVNSATSIDMKWKITNPTKKILNNQQIDLLRSITGLSLNHKIIFANFWFANCPPCIAEFPALNNLYDSLKQHSDIIFLSFAMENQDTINIFKKRYQIRFPVYSISSEQNDFLQGAPIFPANIIWTEKWEQAYIRRGGSQDILEAKEFFQNSVLPLLIQLETKKYIHIK
ncbi:MAG: TlpA family protein disulfide reductase [Bacteroidota bacterium]|uniref:TlpA family protein disulfide reductase n=1 Tax=Hydrotalea lipotrueae TaxID=2803817 RepID=UPI001C476AA9|nr:thioredoxin-like domain-containing protein [Hydrotalea lipotrueae]